MRLLPKQPNLEQLRKQARDLLKRYRAGEPAAVSEVEQYERQPDAIRFALHDAQRVLARAYGYESWPRLKAFVDGANVQRLAAAVQAGDVSKVRALLSVRAELLSMDLAADNEHRALHFAVLRRDVAMVRLLMEAGADARKGIYPHRDATSALALARDREYQEIVTAILGEEVRRVGQAGDGKTLVSDGLDKLNAAILRGDDDGARRLVEADRGSIDVCDQDGAMPLALAAHAAKEEMVAWLLARGASVSARDLQGRTALDYAALSADPRNQNAARFPAIARRLLARGAEFTIFAAVALADAVRVRELVLAEPGVLCQIGSSGGLLTLAVNHGQTEIAALLLDLGADVDERIMLRELEEPTPSWGMPLWHAALANHYELAKLLLDRGADPNANVYASGWPLRNAWNHPDDRVKKLLLERGATAQPYMVAEAHDVAEARRRLEADGNEDLAREFVWSAADHGCPDILELALPRLAWPLDDARWHWALIQPIRGAGGNGVNPEGHFASLELLLKHGVDANVTRYGATALHFAAGYRSAVDGSARARFAAILLDHGARLDLRDDLLKSTPLGWACRWGRKELVELLISRAAHRSMNRTQSRGPHRRPGRGRWGIWSCWEGLFNAEPRRSGEKRESAESGSERGIDAFVGGG